MLDRKNYRHDPLYRIIEISDEIKFIEGSFKYLFDRLKKINNLGILPEIYEMARYPKYEHYLGTYHQVENLVECKKDMKEKYSEALRIAAIFMHTGHFPFTYATEKALILSSEVRNDNINNNVRKYIEDKLKLLFDEIDLEESVGEKIKKRLFSLKSYTSLYKYLSSSIFLGKWKKIKEKFNSEDSLKEIILKDMILEKNHGYKLLNLADKADYAQRDALYLGTVQIDISPKHLYMDIDALNNSSMIETKELINKNLEYLDERFYKNKKYSWFIRLYEKIVAALIQSKNFEIEFLEKYNDESFKRLITENITENKNEANLPDSWVKKADRLFQGDIEFELLFFLQHIYIEEDISSIEFEYELVSKKKSQKGLLNYPFKRNILLDIDYDEEVIFPEKKNKMTVGFYQKPCNNKLMPILNIIRNLRKYWAFSEVKKIKRGICRKLSYNDYIRFDSNIEDCLAKAIESIEKDDFDKGGFIKKFLKNLKEIKTFSKLWDNYHNKIWYYSLISEISSSNTTDEIYQMFAKRLLSIPIRLLQFKNNKDCLTTIENKIIKILRSEDFVEEKGDFFETLCFLKRITNENNVDFKFLINGLEDCCKTP